jgi:hypothetical protein
MAVRSSLRAGYCLPSGRFLILICIGGWVQGSYRELNPWPSGHNSVLIAATLEPRCSTWSSRMRVNHAAQSATPTAAVRSTDIRDSRAETCTLLCTHSPRALWQSSHCDSLLSYLCCRPGKFVLWKVKLSLCLTN